MFVTVDPHPSEAMHPLSSAAAYQQSMAAAGYGAVPGMDGGGQPSPSVEGAGSPHGDGSGADQHQNGSGGANYGADINQLLDQILNITEQSLDEAQVSLLDTIFCGLFFARKNTFFKGCQKYRKYSN